MKKLIQGHFDQKPFVTKCVWLLLVTLAFLVCFYVGTAVMSVMYPLDEAPFRF